MKLVEKSRWFLSGPPARLMSHRAPGLVLPVGKNNIHKFKSETPLIGNWHSIISFDYLCAKNFSEILPDAIYLAHHPALNSK
jgi:hypothetical protein